MGFDQTAPALAKRIIAKNPRPYTLYEPSAAYDENTGDTTGPETERPVTGSLMLKLKKVAAEQSTIRVGDGYFYLAAEGMGFTPATGWRVDAEGSEFRIVGVDTVPGAGLPYFHKVYVRGGA